MTEPTHRAADLSAHHCHVAEAMEQLGMVFDSRKESDLQVAQTNAGHAERGENAGGGGNENAGVAVGAGAGEEAAGEDPYRTLTHTPASPSQPLSKFSPATLKPWTDEEPTKAAAADALATHFFSTQRLREPWADHPLSEKHPLRTLRVDVFPNELILVVRGIQILKAISEEAGVVDWDLAGRWRPHALAALGGGA